VSRSITRSTEHGAAPNYFMAARSRGTVAAVLAVARLPRMRVIRSLLIFKLGVWAGMATAAAFVKHAVPSRGDENSDELSLIAVFDGIELKSRAKAFKGGSMVAWFGGIEVDLREAELVPGARLSVRTLFGGIEIKTPPSWRVESSVKAFAGGVDAHTPARDDPNAPVLTLEGSALFGGIAVDARADAPSARG
jgi:hypothetical protein